MISMGLSWLCEPFALGFMRRALVACMALSLSCGPIGVLLVLRRMSLMGDALSHAILPGAAIGFAIGGFSLTAMGIGGFVAGLVVALLAGGITRLTGQREDASFAAFYLIALALGVLIVSLKGSSVDLLHVLFGSILAVDDTALLWVAAIASLTLLILAVVYRPLVVECFDPEFLQAVHGHGVVYHALLLALIVLNLVAGFQALGTLMAVGLMMLPAAAARFWAQSAGHMMGVATGIALLSSYTGLLFSYHAHTPSGPTIILSAGVCYLLSMALGPYDSLRVRFFHHQHLRG